MGRVRQQLAAAHFPVPLQPAVFPPLFVGFGVLGALYPFHPWPPDGPSPAPALIFYGPLAEISDAAVQALTR